jgi:hypothetical protein
MGIEHENQTGLNFKDYVTALRYFARLIATANAGAVESAFLKAVSVLTSSANMHLTPEKVLRLLRKAETAGRKSSEQSYDHYSSVFSYTWIYSCCAIEYTVPAAEQWELPTKIEFHMFSNSVTPSHFMSCRVRMTGERKNIQRLSMKAA